jgi:hypothetical protein
MRHLVDKAVAEKAVLRMIDRAPEADQHNGSLAWQNRHDSSARREPSRPKNIGGKLIDR